MILDYIPGEDIKLPLVARIGVHRHQKAERLTWHSHKGFELLFLLNGATSYEFQGGRSVELPGEHFLVVTPKTTHRGVHNVRMPSTVCGVLLNPEPQKHIKNTPFTAGELRCIIEHFQRSELSVYSFNRDLKRIVARIVAEKAAFEGRKTDPLLKATMRSLVCAAILEASQQMAALPAPDPKELVGEAANFLRENYDEAIGIPDLVRHMGFGRVRMFQLFKAGTGLTPNDYLQRVRIEKAQGLLRDTDKPITEIALATGFSSSQYFSTVFRRYTGESPLSYREKRLN